MNADTFESATTAAAHGGTTTVISFAAQHVGMSLKTVVDEYHEAAERGAHVDYAFHMILADPRPEVLKDELPPLARSGHGSLKVFLTYDRLRVDDLQLLDVLEAARAHGQMVCIHAENHGMISWMGRKLVEKGYTQPRYHVPSHPRVGEVEAINRAIDGIGREQAALLRKNIPKYQSMGMNINNERIKLLSQANDLHIQIMIEDKKSGDGVPLGTKVTIHIPAPNP